MRTVTWLLRLLRTGTAALLLVAPTANAQVALLEISAGSSGLMTQS
jgi:hypothetical protein